MKTAQMGEMSNVRRVVPVGASRLAKPQEAAEFVLPSIVDREPRRLDPALSINRHTLLEQSLPYRELSLIARADRRTSDPAYVAHRWWARRPPSVMRGLILAAALPGGTRLSEYWKAFESGNPCLEGMRVHDMFAGGGSVLVEAARLGAEPSGTDIDPLAVRIVEHELNPPEMEQVRSRASELLAFLKEKVGYLYAPTRARGLPLHYFYLYQVTCPLCQASSPLYRSLVIARDSRKSGAVVRGESLIVFCPDCFTIHPLKDRTRKILRCCRQRPLFSGTFTARRFTCPGCGTRSLHRDLQTARSPRHLLAIEETNADSYRQIRAPDQKDRAQLDDAALYVRLNASDLATPHVSFREDRLDSRPRSLGFDSPTELFTDRQVSVFGHAFRWLQTTESSPSVVRALSLAVSNALTTNNRLCGYATDYGRLAPLFSVRSYSLPALSVELNPFHATGGRGTLLGSLERVVLSGVSQVRRHVWSMSHRRPIRVSTEYLRRAVPNRIQCASAAEVLRATAKDIDICIFDPPYFDYIAYSELSEFYRAWWGVPELGGIPLLPSRDQPVTSFGHAFGACLRAVLGRLKPGRPLAFTYHSARADAWVAVGVALDAADLLVTAMWPILNDAHMGHHTAAGNCEWDIVVVCRRRAECVRSRHRGQLSEWKATLRPLKISSADQTSMTFAMEMARRRYGSPRSARLATRQTI